MKKKLFLTLLLLVTCLLLACGCKKDVEVEYTSAFDKYEQYITVEEGYEISDFNGLTGEEFTYIVYEMQSVDEENQKYWQAVVTKEDSVVTVIRQDIEDGAGPWPSTVDLISEIDVNFDGRNDVLVYIGSFGAQGASAHRCFLQNEDGTLYESESFPVYNIAVSDTFHAIRTTWRNHAAEHEEIYYEYKNGKFVPVQKIIFTPHVLAYEYHENASDWLGDDPTVYSDKDYRCAIEYVYAGSEWKLYKICENEADSNYYEHKSMCYYEKYEYIGASKGTEFFAGI